MKHEISILRVAPFYNGDTLQVVLAGTINQADDCSRGISPTHLTNHHRWFRGSEFSYLHDDSWSESCELS